MKILILCTGNSCRSQMAHGFLQSFDASLEVYSGGTEPAAQVNPKAVEVMKEAGIDISSHTPVSVRTCLDQAWDYVITVCGGANESCPAFTGKPQERPSLSRLSSAAYAMRSVSVSIAFISRNSAESKDYSEENYRSA